MARLPAIDVPSADSTPQLVPVAHAVLVVAVQEVALPSVVYSEAPNWKMPAHPVATWQSAVVEVFASFPTKT